MGINVLGIVIVLTKHVILSMVHVLLVDVNVDIKGIHVVQVRNMDLVYIHCHLRYGYFLMVNHIVMSTV